MRAGVLTHAWETARATLLMERIASMADHQLLVQRIAITAKQAGSYCVEAIANTEVRNLPVH